MIEPEFQRVTRESYDVVAADYTEYGRGDLERKPLDRALLAAFAETVAGQGPVLDVGSGTAWVTAHLHSLGLDVAGVDLSTGMVEVARRNFPQISFEVGSMLALDRPDGAVHGLVAYYSIIHVPEDRLPRVFAEFHRVLAPEGRLFVSFQVGTEPLRLTDVLGHPVTIEFRRFRSDRIAELLGEAGFHVESTTVRAPVPDTESAPQAYLLARRPQLRQARPVGTGRA